MSEPSMHDLAARLARGDEAAFAELYDACADRLHAYLVGRLGCTETASDVMQSAFLRVVKSRRRFRAVENPVAYVFQIARNEMARSIGKRRLNKNEFPAEVLFATGTDLQSEAENAEVAAAALARLANDERELIELRVFVGLTFGEIAEIVGRPQATVATQYRRAIESLRGWLTRQFR
jgi:RNA polymerase sigma-70 factor (ECF subfamily)